MPSVTLVAGWTAGLLTAAAAAVAIAPFAATPPAEPAGHLILQVEGDARGLAVVRITAKADPCGRAAFASPYQAVVRDAAGRELGAVPMDLSAFDLDPARVGAGLRVQGCLVTDTRVATLVSVPRWAEAAAIELRHGSTVLGRIVGAELQALVQAGESR